MIKVLFQTESHFPVDRHQVKQAIISALAKKLKSDSEVSVAIVGDRRMTELNKKYRHLAETTDVLSFPFNDPSVSGVPFVDAPDEILRLGDIIISYPQAVAEAAQENKLVDEVVVELVLHGLNHLLGIHHPDILF